MATERLTVLLTVDVEYVSEPVLEATRANVAQHVLEAARDGVARLSLRPVQGLRVSHFQVSRGAPLSLPSWELP